MQRLNYKKLYKKVLFWVMIFILSTVVIIYSYRDRIKFCTKSWAELCLGHYYFFDKEEFFYQQVPKATEVDQIFNSRSKKVVLIEIKSPRRKGSKSYCVPCRAQMIWFGRLIQNKKYNANFYWGTFPNYRGSVFFKLFGGNYLTKDEYKCALKLFRGQPNTLIFVFDEVEKKYKFYFAMNGFNKEVIESVLKKAETLKTVSQSYNCELFEDFKRTQIKQGKNLFLFVYTQKDNFKNMSREIFNNPELKKQFPDVNFKTFDRNKTRNTLYYQSIIFKYQYHSGYSSIGIFYCDYNQVEDKIEVKFINSPKTKEEIKKVLIE